MPRAIAEAQVWEVLGESLDLFLQPVMPQKARDFSLIWKEAPGSGPWRVPGCPQQPQCCYGAELSSTAASSQSGHEIYFNEMTPALTHVCW